MDDDGWTTVPRNKKLRPPKSTLPSQGQDRQVSVEKLLADYERYIRWWKTSECRRALRQTLDKVKPDEGWQIKEAIILGSGSFTRDNMECVKRSMLQITAFKDIVQHIQSTSTDDIKIIAQEPQYTSVDRRFLSELGIVVHDAEFNDSGRMWFNLQYGAMVFEAFMEMNLGDLEKLVQWDPKLYIGSSLQGRLDLLPLYMIDMDMRSYSQLPHANLTFNSKARNLPSREDFHKHAARLKRTFETERRMLRFPTFDDDPNVFSGLQILWKEPDDDENEA